MRTTPLPALIGFSGHVDGSALRKFNRVAHQVVENLQKSRRISYQALRCPLLDSSQENQSFRARLWSVKAHELIECLIEVDSDRLQLDLTRFDL